MKIKVLLMLCLILSCSWTLTAARVRECEGNVLEVTTLYGTMVIEEPVLIELITSASFSRLKHIRQYGVTCHVRQEADYTRYTHSLGVLHILKLFGASLEEQIDGLLHDVSHTIFSHAGDYLFDHCHKMESYQDTIHEWFLDVSGLATTLQRHGFKDACSYACKKRHRCLEQDKPDLCADRIEYNLTGGVIEGLLNQDELNAIIKSLHFEDQQWFFDNKEHAKKFAIVSLQLSQRRWGALWNVVADYCVAQALRCAYTTQIISTNDIHFSTDDEIWSTLQKCNDSRVQCWLRRIERGDQAYYLTTQEKSDLYMRGKFSGTNPLIVTPEGLTRLSVLDKDFAHQYAQVQKSIAQGWYIAFNEG